MSPEATARDPHLAAGEDYGNPDPEWPGIDWRSLLRRVELPGAEVNYVELGEGDPIVFVHGISGCWQNWLENLPHFARSHRAIALDLPGFGDSPMPSWPIDVAAYGRLLHGFCEKLGVQGGTVVGNSMGGLVAIEALTATPGRFDRLVLVCSAGIINTWSPKPRATATAWAWKHFGPGFRRREREIISRPRLRQAVFGPFIHAPEKLRDDLLLEQMDNGLRKADGFGEALQTTIETDIRPRLGEIDLPTLVVGGLSDHVVPVAAAVSLHRRIPHSRLEIFERTGHVPQMERPARFNALVDEFLAG